MKEIVPIEIQKYAEAHSSEEPPLLQSINRETHVNYLFPRMLSGHLQGRFLSMISHMIKPGLVLEIGTYTGYSAICLAEGLSDGGVIYSIELNNELEEVVRKNILDAGLQGKIQLIFGNAVTIWPQLPAGFDLIFLDADKDNYVIYYELAIGSLRPGGFLIVDNVLWSGKVVYGFEIDKETKRLREFNEIVALDNRVEKVMLPFRDGITLIRKKL